MINRVSDLKLSEPFTDELLRLVKLDRNWVTAKSYDDQKFDATVHVKNSFRFGPNHIGRDMLGMLVLSRWLLDGPKIVRPTAEQCEIMSNVEVHLEFNDCGFPYPQVLVDFPVESPYTCCIIGKVSDDFIIANVMTYDHQNDIIVVICQGDGYLENSLRRFDETITSDEAVEYSKWLRVAFNCALALAGGEHRYVLEKECQRDIGLSKERSERGERAKKRLETAVQIVGFHRSIKLTKHTRSIPGEPTGIEVSPHWRKGHWRMQACGVGLSERKRILVPPVFVRQDRFFGERSDTTTEYL